MEMPDESFITHVIQTNGLQFTNRRTIINFYNSIKIQSDTENKYLGTLISNLVKNPYIVPEPIYLYQEEMNSLHDDYHNRQLNESQQDDAEAFENMNRRYKLEAQLL